jgi:hypothetical protein
VFCGRGHGRRELASWELATSLRGGLGGEDIPVGELLLVAVRTELVGEWLGLSVYISVVYDYERV